MASVPTRRLMEEANGHNPEARDTIPKSSRDFMASPRSSIISIPRSPLASIPNPNPSQIPKSPKLHPHVMASPRSPLISIPRSPLAAIPDPSQSPKSTVARVSSTMFSDLPPFGDPRGTTRKRTLRSLLEDRDLSFRDERNAKVNEDSLGDVMALQRRIQVLKDQLESFKMPRESHATSGENHSESDSVILLNQKVGELEAALAGSLNRERIAEAEVKRLKTEMKHMEHLVHDLREKLKETRRLEGELTGKLDCVRGAALAMSELHQEEFLECLPQLLALKHMHMDPCELFSDESLFDKIAEQHQGELMDMRKSVCNLSVVGSSQSLPAGVDLASDESPSEVH